MMTTNKADISKQVPLFRDQARLWLENGKNRKRSPFRPSTARTYLSQLETNILPYIGSKPLDVVGNKAVNELVSELASKGKSPATIDLIINIIKEIRASATDNDGQELFPYKWVAEKIDAPILDRKQQKTPIATSESISNAIRILLEDIKTI